jgi:hypothetical protein
MNIKTENNVQSVRPSDDLILQVDELVVSYGSIQAIHGISLDVRKGELVNICFYAYDAPGGIVICHKQSWEDGTVAIQFTDSGKPFDPTAEVIKAEDYDPDHQIGGLGMLIAQSFADCYRYVNIEGNNVLLIIKHGKEVRT